MMIWIHVTLLWISRHFEGLLSWVEWMRDGRTLLWLQKKRQSKQRIPIIQMCAVFVALNCKISVGNKNNQRSFQPFPSPKRNIDILNSCQNQLEEPPKHLFLLVNEKHTPFARALTPILQDKKQTDDQNQNILQQILLNFRIIVVSLELVLI